jgi:hypothetical protein
MSATEMPSSAYALTRRARDGPADRAARPGCGTARATGGAWRRGKIKAPRGAASGENARGLGSMKPWGARQRRRRGGWRTARRGCARRRGADGTLVDTISD